MNFLSGICDFTGTTDVSQCKEGLHLVKWVTE